MRRQFLLVLCLLPRRAGPEALRWTLAPETGPVTYERVQSIFNRSCVISSSCHNADGMRGDLDLTAAVSVSRVANVDSIQPWRKLGSAGRPREQRRLLEQARRHDAHHPDLHDARSRTALRTRMPTARGATLRARRSRAQSRAWIAAGAVGPRRIDRYGRRRRRRLRLTAGHSAR